MSFNGPRVIKSERSNSDAPKPNASKPNASEPISITPPSMLTHFETMKAHSAPVSALESTSCVVGSPLGFQRRKFQQLITQTLQAKAEAEAEAAKDNKVAEKPEEEDDDLNMHEEDIDVNVKSEEDDDLCGVFDFKL